MLQKPGLLNEFDVARALGVSVGLVRKWRYDQNLNAELPVLHVGRCVRYQLSDVEAFIARRRGASAPAAELVPAA